MDRTIDGYRLRVQQALTKMGYSADQASTLQGRHFLLVETLCHMGAAPLTAAQDIDARLFPRTNA